MSKNLKQCQNGHYYDGDKYPSCPHCGGSFGGTQSLGATAPFDGETMPPQKAFSSANVPSAGSTVPMGYSPQNTSGYGGVMPGSTVPMGYSPQNTSGYGVVTPGSTVPMKGGYNFVGGTDETIPLQSDTNREDNGATTSYYERSAGESSGKPFKPVVGWLVCTKGKHIGESFNIYCERNFIGRDASNTVALSGETSVSRSKQAIIAYDPMVNEFFATPGEAASLFYVNGKAVLTQAELKRGDRIQVGAVELMFVPCCDENFKWFDPENNA